MTIEELESYLGACLPSLRKKYVRESDDDDVIQQTCLDLMHRAAGLLVTSEEGFRGVFASFFYRLKWVRRTRQSTQRARQDPMLSVTMESHIIDPWNTTMVQALECIAMIPHERTRQVMRDYYVSGYNLIEIGKRRGLGKSSVQRILQTGIEHIKTCVIGDLCQQ